MRTFNCRSSELCGAEERLVHVNEVARVWRAFAGKNEFLNRRDFRPPMPAVKPRGSPKWAVTGEVGDRRQVATLSFRSLFHPRGIVGNALPRI